MKRKKREREEEGGRRKEEGGRRKEEGGRRGEECAICEHGREKRDDASE